MQFKNSYKGKKIVKIRTDLFFKTFKTNEFFTYCSALFNIQIWNEK